MAWRMGAISPAGRPERMGANSLERMGPAMAPALGAGVLLYGPGVWVAVAVPALTGAIEMSVLWRKS